MRLLSSVFLPLVCSSRYALGGLVTPPNFSPLGFHNSSKRSTNEPFFDVELPKHPPRLGKRDNAVNNLVNFTLGTRGGKQVTFSLPWGQMLWNQTLMVPEGNVTLKEWNKTLSRGSQGEQFAYMVPALQATCNKAAKLLDRSRFKGHNRSVRQAFKRDHKNDAAATQTMSPSRPTSSPTLTGEQLDGIETVPVALEYGMWGTLYYALAEMDAITVWTGIYGTIIFTLGVFLRRIGASLPTAEIFLITGGVVLGIWSLLTFILELVMTFASRNVGVDWRGTLALWILNSTFLRLLGAYISFGTMYLPPPAESPSMTHDIEMGIHQDDDRSLSSLLDSRTPLQGSLMDVWDEEELLGMKVENEEDDVRSSLLKPIAPSSGYWPSHRSAPEPITEPIDEDTPRTKDADAVADEDDDSNDERTPLTQGNAHPNS